MVKEEEGVAMELETEGVLDELEEMTRNAVAVQRETLRRILEENCDSEYLKMCDLHGRTDLESFRKCVPLVTHQELEPYIQRVADGEPHVLTSKPMDRISLSSGTTRGKPKYIPFNEDLALTTMEIYRKSFALRNRDFPINKEGKALQFIYGSKQSVTKGGLIATTATTNIYCSGHFSKTMSEIKSAAVSPSEVIFSPDFHQSLYCHLLCGLLFREEVEVVSSTFAHSIVLSFRALEVLFEDLCRDIRLGVLSEKVTVPSMREAVSKLLHRPNPELADLIHSKCRGLTNWYGVIPELWPNAKYVLGIMTGSMEPYVQKLRHYAGNLPLVSSDYGASEGWIGVNAYPKASSEYVKFVILPNIGFFEFIPIQREAAAATEEEIEVVGLGEVEVGKDYEIVLTNAAGLYRYRLGDVVQVAGFYNSSPLLKFLCRRSLLLNINIDKNTEADLQLAVEEAGKLLAAEKVEIVDFTSFADRSSDPGHYVIYWELNKGASKEMLFDCCNRLDRAFVDAGYVSSRKVGGIGALELRVVKKGTFNRVMEHFVGMGATVNQFKTPRCIGSGNNGRLLKILEDGVMGRCWSTAYDL